jgi:hypothetical protein
VLLENVSVDVVYSDDDGNVGRQLLGPMVIRLDFQSPIKFVAGWISLSARPLFAALQLPSLVSFTKY